jgi:hypothetical protein
MAGKYNVKIFTPFGLWVELASGHGSGVVRRSELWLRTKWSGNPFSGSSPGDGSANGFPYVEKEKLLSRLENPSGSRTIHL